LKSRFDEQVVELLTLSSALSPKDAYKSFEIDDICKLAEKFYSKDFNVQERFLLVAEGLRSMISRTELQGKISGVPIAARGTRLTLIFLQMIAFFFAGLLSRSGEISWTFYKLMKQHRGRN
jgi:hypothetical protein